jgi:cytochrome P450
MIEISFEVALQTVIAKFVAVILTSIIPVSSEFLLNLLPEKVTSIKFAAAEFRRNLREIIEEERTFLKTKTNQRDNLMSALVHASDLEGTQGDRKKPLTEEEIYGNLFIYSFAGHDTTANTMTYTVALLASDRRMQSWIKEEIHSVIGKESDPESWEYEKLFPQLKRCLAVMVRIVSHGTSYSNHY